MENTVQTVPEVDERRSGPPASPFATTDLLGRFLSRYWGVELAVGVLTGRGHQDAEDRPHPARRRSHGRDHELLRREQQQQQPGVVALVNPVDTFTGLADILGFIFLLIGVQWMVQAFAERLFNPTGG